MAGQGNATKASHYLSQLDAARCNGEWEKVPELSRKVGKHAPSRKGLALTASLEAQIAQSVRQKIQSKGEGPAISSNSLKSFWSRAEALRAVLQEAQISEEDAFQAKTSLAWLCWESSDWNRAIANLPPNLPTLNESKSEKQGSLQGWTLVCAIKTAVIHATAEESRGKENEANLAYQMHLRRLMDLPVFTSRGSEHRSWLNRFLTRCCNALHKGLPKGSTEATRSRNTNSALIAYRCWAKSWEPRSSRQSLTSGVGAESKITEPNRLLWKAYYDLLTDILRYGYSYSAEFPSTGSSTGSAQVSKTRKRQQHEELKQVEDIYEQLLIEELSFPQASKINHEVDDWANQAVSNWCIYCGPSWHDEDLEQGSKELANRRMLDILYRASTRTFHSTTVLRHLISVHSSLADFTLARKALQSYFGIASKGKARVQKTGEAEPGLDSDDLMLRTLAGGVRMLCEYGKREEAIQAQTLADFLEKWTLEHDVTSKIAAEGRPKRQEQEEGLLTSQTLASIHHAIGISRASWARLTYEATSRGQLQNTALRHLQTALTASPTSSEDPSILYSLATIMAERRDVDAAITTVKRALAAESRVFTEPVDESAHPRENEDRSSSKTPIVECWHLLSLLLSARQEFEAAEACCDVAIEQFQPETSQQHDGTPRSSNIIEKTQIIEAKITQVLLAEINHGTESAVNSSGELFQMYTRLFGSSNKRQLAPVDHVEVPRTAGGTVKSVKRSFSWRGREGRTSTGVSSVNAPTQSVRLSNDTTRPPTISVTDEKNSVRPQSSHIHSLSHRPSQKLQKRPSKKSIRRSRTASPSPSRTSVPAIQEPPAQAIAPNGNVVRPDPTLLQAEATPAPDPSEVGLAVSHDLRASVTAQLDALSMATLIPSMAQGSEEDREKARMERLDEIISAVSYVPPHTPSPIFPESTQQRFSYSLLTKIWLLIASLYRRANLFEDASGAVEEAFKQAKLIESIVASAESSTKSFEEVAWAGFPSIERVWADAYTEMGHLSAAQSKTYEAMIRYEGALSHFPDHPDATVALASLLLDVYTEKIPPQPKRPPLFEGYWSGEEGNGQSAPTLSAVPSSPVRGKVPPQAMNLGDTEAFPTLEAEEAIEDEGSTLRDEPSGPADEDAVPRSLDRLAARDRAYGLLSSLTKLGTAWDDVDAWFTLARAYEESGELDKAKEVLWWVVDLEEKRPVRHWSCLGQGYSLRF